MDPDMRLGIQMTHSDECYRWHHECAVVKVDALRARIEVLEKVAEAAINYRNNETRDNCEVLEEAIAALDALKEGK